ncbi:syntaxin 18 [Kwoniella heveanensis CBS 569]|uniref:Syntaxin 18 n=1 Tax=Kwoniella heveanensis BCC8398 TaxID=1296120 RepID=A0A1B9GX22_9TREE|nr:syntaxin 18 [Kwoniella heveanensis BCC8398]OCF39777.1 syntaxin 18 [Kwoniella heveanensis CBS 569]
MPPHDQTGVFHSILDDHLASSSSSGQSNGNATSKRPKSPFEARVGAGASRSPSRSRKGKEVQKEEEEFLKEAYRIHAHLASLTHLLKTVRKAYLSTIEPPPLSRRAPRDRTNPYASSSSSSDPNVQEDGAAEGEWRKWEKVKYLTDKERDEIDLRARMILRRCKDRVGVLELSEQARKSKAPSSSSHTQQTLLSFLPSLLASEEQTNLSRIYPPIITAHRASVLWYLNTYLSKLTSTLSDLQEERYKRREERGRSLGAGASLELASIGAKKDISGGLQSGGRRIPDGMIVDVHDPAFSLHGGSATDPHLGAKGSAAVNGSGTGIGIIDASAGPVEAQLTPAQIQQFESENNVLLDQMSSTLSSVLSAESSLLEISQLQSELIQHLSSQNEMIDQLYEDAIGSLGSLGDANEQLKKARERGKESRLFLIVFLLGASLGLLFLDWYAK